MSVVARLAEAAANHPRIERGALDALVEWLDGAGGGASADAGPALARLAQMRCSLAEGGRDTGEITGEWPGTS